MARFGQLGVLTGDSPAASQPDYGAVRFGGDFAPRLGSPLRAGVPGLREALALAPVAVNPDDNRDLSCGDRVYIVGLGVKTVTDRCPVCTPTQLDNYTTTPACSKVYDLGTYKTIKL